MRMPLETKNYLEHGAKEVHDLPNNHTEGMDTAKLEKLSVPDAAQEVGRKYFEDRVAGTPGKLAEFRSLEKDGNAEKFAEHYKTYVVKPSELKKNDPEMYDFMKERVFNRKEYADRSNAISFTGSDKKNSVVDRKLVTVDPRMYK